MQIARTLCVMTVLFVAACSTPPVASSAAEAPGPTAGDRWITEQQRMPAIPVTACVPVGGGGVQCVTVGGH
jgi:hypothetical protein